jgi:hypothetical protein
MRPKTQAWELGLRVDDGRVRGVEGIFLFFLGK